MTTRAETSEGTLFCLRGEIEGDERRFPLPRGVHLVGSSTEADIVLPTPGVSRRHASLEVDTDRLRLIDLESKNGSFVDDQRVTEAPLHLGDPVRFGPVSMRVDAMDPEDGALGLELAPLSRPGSEIDRDPGSTVLVDGDSLDGGIVDHLMAIVDLLTLPRPDLEAVAARLRSTIDADAVAFVEGHRGAPPTLLASAGTPGRLPALHALVDGPPQSALTAAVAPVPAGGLAGWVAWNARPGAASKIWLDAATHLVRRLVAEDDVAEDDVAEDGVTEAEAGHGWLAGSTASTDATLELPPGIVAGRSAAMLAIYQQMASIAPTDSPVLVLGETGVGKEHLAQAMHLGSPRRDRPFVVVNCAAIPAELLEAEMFGIGKGVATGVDARPGCFRQADGGTLFLDEVGELPLALQAKLLRALQDGQVHPVGGPATTVDVRVVAATNADLDSQRDAGRFRSDLYFRLAGFEIDVPPLRDRPDDLPPLISHFLERFGDEAGKRVRGLSVKALRLLSAYDWPGNVRELEHEIRRLVFRAAPRQAIDSSHLSPRIRDGLVRGAEARLGELDGVDGRGLSLDRRLDALQIRLISQALASTAGNQTRAAEVLGISRSGLIKRMKRLGIDPKAVVS